MPGSARAAATSRSIRSATICFSAGRSCAHSAVNPPDRSPEPGEVLDARAVLEPGVALEVEVEVAGARRRQAQQPEAGLRVEQRARRLPGRPLLQLLGRLLLQPGARVGADAGRLQQLRRRRRQRRQRRDADRPQRVAVVAAHDGDQAEVVGLPQLGVAPLGPAALLAVADRRGSGRRRRGDEASPAGPARAGRTRRRRSAATAARRRRR